MNIEPKPKTVFCEPHVMPTVDESEWLSMLETMTAEEACAEVGRRRGS